MSIFIYPLFQTYAADIFFAQTWKDNRLRLPENMTSEYRYMKSSWFNLKNNFCHFKIRRYRCISIENYLKNDFSANKYEKSFKLCCYSRLLEVDWLKNMWRPDSFFKNAKSVTFQTMTIPNHYLWLYKDKTILYMVK